MNNFDISIRLLRTMRSFRHSQQEIKSQNAFEELTSWSQTAKLYVNDSISISTEKQNYEIKCSIFCTSSFEWKENKPVKMLDSCNDSFECIAYKTSIRIKQRRKKNVPGNSVFCMRNQKWQRRWSEGMVKQKKGKPETRTRYRKRKAINWNRRRTKRRQPLYRFNGLGNAQIEAHAQATNIKDMNESSAQERKQKK